jgi:hypothetical protein
MSSLADLSVDLIFPIRDRATARFAVTKAECLHAAGLIDAQFRDALAAKAAKFMNNPTAVSLPRPNSLREFKKI